MNGLRENALRLVHLAAFAALAVACGKGAEPPAAPAPSSAPGPPGAAPTAEPAPGAPLSTAEIARQLAASRRAPITPAEASDLPPTAWVGQVLLPGDQSLGLSVRFTSPADPASPPPATLSSPTQLVVDAPVTDVVFARDRLAFTLLLPVPAGATARFEATAAPPPAAAAPGTPWKAAGTLTQQGQTFELILSSAVDLPSGPATPANPAFPSRDVTVPSAAPDVTLAGTLTLPTTPGPHPAVVFISGSGPQDRDEAILGFRPFALLADALAAAGYASLRLDDRGVGGSGGTFDATTVPEATADIVNAVRFLAADPDVSPLIDPARIGLLGHSEGALIAALAAASLARASTPAAPAAPAASPRVAFVISLAGPAVPILDLLAAQQRAVLAPLHVPPDAMEALVAANQKALRLLATDAPPADTIAALEATVVLLRAHAPSLAASLPLEGAGAALYDAQRSPRLRTFLAADAPAAWRALDVPVLAIQGALDTQVDAAPNLAAFRAAIPAERLTTVEVPGANHLFQAATTGLPDEYATLPPAFAPGVVDGLVTWLKAR